MTHAVDGVTVQFDVPARMRDGVTLRADVYRRQGTERAPTLLMRTPYGKRTPVELAWCGLDPVQAARQGFMVVIQDTRGRFASEGQWDPFRYEQADGYDSVEWAAALPGGSGRVAMFGGSYHGNTQLLAAIAGPPSLAAISPQMTWSEPMDGLLARGGAIELGTDLAWSLLCGLDHIGRLGRQPDQVTRRLETILRDWDELGSSGYWQLPVQEMDVLRRHPIPDLGSLRGAQTAEVASWCRVSGAHHRIQVPSLHTAGWHDVFLQGTLDNYQAMASSGHEARLVVGPWTHERFHDPIGQQVFGIRSSRDGAAVHPYGDWNDMRLAWLRRHLEPGANVEFPDTPVRVFVMGRNEWRDETCWPPSGVVSERWFLQPDGGLSQVAPRSEGSESRFVYDPASPVPTLGGHSLMWSGYPAGPTDQAEIEARQDVVVFTSDVLEQDLEITGRVYVALHAQSSAPASDWVARLCDVHPDGRSFNLCDGIIRTQADARQAARYEIDLWSTSNVFLAGHRLRMHITSSSFPRWDRNLNTGNQESARHAVAHQRIFHDATRASYIALPTLGQA